MPDTNTNQTELDTNEKTILKITKMFTDNRTRRIETNLEAEDIREWWGHYWGFVREYGIRQSRESPEFNLDEWNEYLDHWPGRNQPNGSISTAMAAYNALWTIVLGSTFCSHPDFEIIALKQLGNALNQFEQSLLISEQFEMELNTITDYCVNESKKWRDMHPEEYRANLSKYP